MQCIIYKTDVFTQDALHALTIVKRTIKSIKSVKKDIKKHVIALITCLDVFLGIKR
jgi:hypothetical protein